jgi:hypothetical protein
MMKLSAKVVGLALTLGLLWICPRPCHAQGTMEPLHITFDGPPPQLPGTGTLIQRYDEAGMSFVPLPGSDGFVRRGGRDRFPENGSASLQAALGTSLMFSFTNGALFDMVSVDLAEFSITATDTTVRFVGYRFDGAIVTTDFTTDGFIDGPGGQDDFETFYFGSEFSGLERVEISSHGWALDNLLVVPEPSAVTLFLAGGMFLCVVRLLRRPC